MNWNELEWRAGRKPRHLGQFNGPPVWDYVFAHVTGDVLLTTEEIEAVRRSAWGMVLPPDDYKPTLLIYLWRGPVPGDKSGRPWFNFDIRMDDFVLKQGQMYGQRELAIQDAWSWIQGRRPLDEQKSQPKLRGEPPFTFSLPRSPELTTRVEPFFHTIPRMKKGVGFYNLG